VLREAPLLRVRVKHAVKQGADEQAHEARHKHLDLIEYLLTREQEGLVCRREFGRINYLKRLIYKINFNFYIKLQKYIKDFIYF